MCFLAFDGLHAQGRKAGVGAAGGACALSGQGEADPAAHPRVGHQQPAQYCGLSRIQELPEEHEVLQGGVPGPAPGRLGAQDFFKAEGKAGSARRGGEAEDPAAQNGKCALCGCGLTAGTCELDHVVPVRQAFASLQALCGDCHRRRWESAQPEFGEPLWFSHKRGFPKWFISYLRVLALVRPAFDLVLRRI